MKWTFGDGDSSFRTSPIHIYDTMGTYTVCLYVYDSTANGFFICDSSCKTITISGSGSNCNASFTYQSQGLVNTFFSNANGRRVRWAFGDGDTSDRSSPIHIYDTIGTYTVCLYVYDSSANGYYVCDSSCQTITIGSNTGGNNCKAQFTYSVDSANSKRIDFTNSSTGAYSVWKFGDGDSSLSRNPSHTYANTGRFFVCLYVYDSTSTGFAICDSMCQTIVISAPPVQCKASFYKGLDTTSKYKVFIVNNSTGTNATTSYLWTFGDGDSSTQKNPTHQYKTFGLYNLCLTITTRTNSGVCTSTHCDSVGMDSSGKLLKKGGFEMVVINEEDILNTEEVSQLNDFSIYPNPTSGKLKLNMSARNGSDVRINVLNTLGSSVLESEKVLSTGDHSLELDISGHPQGIYFVKIEAGNEIKTLRVILAN